MSPTLVHPKASSRANKAIWTKNPQEGTIYMDNNTTLDQQSLPWTMKSSMKVVHGRSPYVHGRPSLLKLDGRIHNTWKSFNSL